MSSPLLRYETALGIASSFGFHDLLFWIDYSLAELFLGKKRFGDAHVHLERVKPHAINHPYYRLGSGIERASLKRRGLRLCVFSMGMGNLGLHGRRSSAERSSGMSRRPLMNRISMVSPHKRCYFLCLLTFHS